MEIEREGGRERGEGGEREKQKILTLIQALEKLVVCV